MATPFLPMAVAAGSPIQLVVRHTATDRPTWSWPTTRCVEVDRLISMTQAKGLPTHGGCVAGFSAVKPSIEDALHNRVHTEVRLRKVNVSDRNRSLLINHTSQIKSIQFNRVAPLCSTPLGITARDGTSGVTFGIRTCQCRTNQIWYEQKKILMYHTCTMVHR